MENRKILKYLIFFILIFTPHGILHAYATNTHASLNRNIAKEFSRLRYKHFSNAELQAFISGGILEDDMIYIRPLNHFYDTVNNKGLDDRVPGVEPRSIDWATNPYMQGNFTRTGHKSSWRIDKDIKLLAYKNDYSWQRAIYEYVYGDKTKAMRALGQVMHLLEDLTSVPHTRDDAHGGFGRGGSSAYEEYTKNLTSHVKLRGVKKYPNIEAIFYATAKYTNENYLSADTIFKKYYFPNKTHLIYKQPYYINPLTNSKIIFLKYRFDKKEESEVQKYVNLDDPHVMQDYWNHLSYKAVESGVALLDLFYREVEKERKEGKLAKMNISYNEAYNTFHDFKNFAGASTGQRIIGGVRGAWGYFSIDPNRYSKLLGALLADDYYKILNPKEKLAIAKALDEYGKEEYGKSLAEQSQKQEASAFYAFKVSLDQKESARRLALMKQLAKEKKKEEEKEKKEAKRKKAEQKAQQKKIMELKLLALKSSEAESRNNEKNEVVENQDAQENNKAKNKESEKAENESAGNKSEGNEGQKEPAQAKPARALLPNNKDPEPASSEQAEQDKKVWQEERRRHRRAARAAAQRVELAFKEIPEIVTDESLHLAFESKNVKSLKLFLNNVEVANASDGPFEFDIQLKEGENHIKALGSNDTESKEIEKTLTLDSPPKIDIEIDCLSLENDLCLLPTNQEYSLTISSDPDAQLKVNNETQEEKIFKEKSRLAKDEEKLFKIEAEDAQSKSAKTLTLKAVLPDIKLSEYLKHTYDRWSPKTDYVWLELKNNSPFPLDLKACHLKLENSRSSGQIKLEGILASGAYYLLEISSNPNLNMKSPDVDLTLDPENLKYFPAGLKTEISLSCYDLETDRVILPKLSVSQTNSYRSFERLDDNSFSRHLCALFNKDFEFDSNYGKEIACATPKLKNENEFYLPSESIENGSIAKGVYLLNRDFIINKDKSLDIEAGVKLINTPYHGTENNPYDVKVYGKLNINGSESEPVYFTDLSDQSALQELLKDDADKYISYADTHHSEFNSIYMSGDAASVKAENFNAKQGIKAKDALSLELKSTHLDSAEKSALKGSIKSIIIENSELASDETTLASAAESFVLKNSKISSRADSAFSFSVLTLLDFENNEFSSQRENFMWPADENIFVDNKSNRLLNFRFDAKENYKLQYIKNEMPLYIDRHFYLNGVDYEIADSTLSTNTIARWFFDKSTVKLKGLTWKSARGGPFFENSNVEISDSEISASGQRHIDTKRADESGALSFINSEAVIKNTALKDYELRGIYAKDSKLELENIIFDGSETEVQNIDSEVVEH